MLRAVGEFERRNKNSNEATIYHWSGYTWLFLLPSDFRSSNALRTSSLCRRPSRSPLSCVNILARSLKVNIWLAGTAVVIICLLATCSSPSVQRLSLTAPRRTASRAMSRAGKTISSGQSKRVRSTSATLARTWSAQFSLTNLTADSNSSSDNRPAPSGRFPLSSFNFSETQCSILLFANYI